MIRAVTEYLRECGRLLKWVFFQPSLLRMHLKQIAPNLGDKEYFFYWLRKDRENRLLRHIITQFFLITSFIPFLFHLLVGFVAFSFDIAFDWSKSSMLVLAFVLLGLIINFRFSAIGGVASGVAIGSAMSVWIGIGAGQTLSVVLGIIGGMFIGTDICIICGLLISVFDASVGLWFCVGVLRLPFYIFGLALTIIIHLRSILSNQAATKLLDIPLYFDELMVLPHPYLSAWLSHKMKNNLEEGLTFLSIVARNPFQRWATQRSITALTKTQIVPFFCILDMLLKKPTPFITTKVFPGAIERARVKDTYFPTKLILAKLSDSWPRLWPNMPNYWPMDYVAFGITFLLRENNNPSLSAAAELYLQLLQSTAWFENYASSDLADHSVKLTDNNSWLYTYLEEVRNLPHGEEVYQSIKTIELALRCEDLVEVAKLKSEFSQLFEISQPLRRELILIFYKLYDVTVDAHSFLIAAHEGTQSNALLVAQGVLEKARQLSNEVYEPERSLLLAVIEHWRRMFAIEGGRVAESREVKVLPNPYVAGRPIRPEDGRLFAGRREEMKLIEEKLQTGVGIVIWGQRRIGKSSILLHLPGHLSHDLLPVYLNLQNLMANTTGGFLHAVAREIAKQMRGVWSSGFSLPGSNGETMPPEGGTPNLPSASEFNNEPYLSFNHLLEQIEERLQPGQRVLLSFDEFEELEQRVKDAKIEKEIFTYLRSITQTGRGFAMLFAGLHTLEEMTREYWNPFFQSVQTIRIGYLGESDAEALIRDPMEQFPLDYELEAVNRITRLTNSHPYLTQSLCHNLVNRLNDPLYRSQLAKQEDVDAVVERTLESGFYYFDDYVWGWSSEQERLALALLAEATSGIGEEAPFAVVEKHLGRETALDATRRLVSREILSERTGESGELVFRFQIPLAQMWVRQKKPSARILMEGGRL